MVGVYSNDKIGFWSQLWKGAEIHNTLIEKQLVAVYAALTARESLTGKQKVKVCTKYPIAGWVRSWSSIPRMGVAQIPTLAKWGTYLEQSTV
jgi:hypothetical protein